MTKSTTSGKILSLLHLGHSVLRREPEMIFYSEDISTKPCRTQRSDAPYIGKVNGVGEGAAAELAFIDYGDKQPQVELLDFYKPHDIHRQYRPGDDAYSHLGFSTKDIDKSYRLAVRKGLSPLGEPELIDYGFAKGKKAFFLLDPDNTYVQVVQNDNATDSEDEVVSEHDHVAMSVADIEETAKVFEDMLCCDVAIEDTRESRYLSRSCVRPVKRVAVCKSKLENYTIELWETGATGGVEDVYISASGTIHLCYLCQGIDNLYEMFKGKGVRFVGPPVEVTKGVNKDSKAIFFQTPGYIWIELLCRKADL
jgi:catechol 2,3-dioxygenase-like lactoylglutathione lyase family enzyme